MKDLSCDAETGYKQRRKTVMEEVEEEKSKGKEVEFREGDVKVGNQYDSVWSDRRMKMTVGMFGNVAWGDEDRSFVREKYYGTARALTARIFEKRISRISRSVTKLEKEERDLEAAFKVAEARPTRRVLGTLTATYSSVLAAHRVLGIQGQLEENSPWRQKIDKLMESLGRAKQNGRNTRVAATHAKAADISPEDLDRAWNEYQTMIWTAHASDVPLEDEEGGEAGLGGEEEEEAAAATAYNMGWQADAGVERWKKEKYEDIWGTLGLGKELPGQKKDGKKASWQQLVAAAEIIDRAMVEDGKPCGNSTLLADDVGMGKTGTAILVIQLLWHLIALQNPPEGEEKKPWPKMLGK
ncbi:hypothetical protein FRC12_009068 [Ceratobasidium sp. 428]|nr:hypothetical protein FRC12_009068 [Ceratobasidium sp. 428]